MDTVIFIIEIDRYFEVYSENAEIAASKNPYSKLIRNTESSEYKEFLYEIISYCESLGLVAIVCVNLFRVIGAFKVP